jgi:hypothetical protein
VATRYWVGGTATWNAVNTANWAASSGGAGGASAPTASDDVVFDVNSNVGTGNFTVTANGAVCNDITVSGLDGTMTLATTSLGLAISGNTAFPATLFQTSGTVGVTFNATSAKTLNTSGVNITWDVTFNGAGGSWQLLANFPCDRGITLTTGTLDLNGFTLTGPFVAASGSSARTLAFGTGKFVLTAASGTVWAIATATNLTVTGTPTVELSGSPVSSTRTIAHGSTAGGSEANSVNFKVLGGSNSVQLNNSHIRGIDFTGFAGTMANAQVAFYGDVVLSSGMTVTGGGNQWTFAKTTGAQTLSSAGPTLNQNIIVNGAGGSLVLGSNISVTGSALSLVNGTLNLAGFTFTATSFSTSAGTKNITWNGGGLTITGTGATAFNNANPTNFTTTAGSAAGTITMSSASAKTFVGGGSTFNAKLIQGGAGTLTLTGSNTLTDIDNTVTATSVLFTAATTTTFTVGFSLDDTTIGSVTAANHNLSMASGSANVSNNTISRSQAAGGATWNAYTTNGNTDGGNNSGWIFTAPAGGSSNFLAFFGA